MQSNVHEDRTKHARSGGEEGGLQGRGSENLFMDDGGMGVPFHACRR